MVKAAAAIACVALVAAVGLDAQRRVPQPPRQRNKAAITVEAVLLAADRIRADRWYPEGTTFEAARALSRAADMDLLVLASESERPDLRRIAVREFGRFETASNAEFISRYLEDEDPDVRIEAADALAQTLIDRPDVAAAAAINPIQFRLRREIEPNVIAAFWKTLAELPLSTQVSAAYEAQFLNEIQQQSPMRIQAGEALVDLLWNRRGRPASAQTVQQLRQWFLLGLGVRDGRVMMGDTVIGFAQTFLEALHAAGVDDDYVLERAESALNWEIRLRAVEMANPFNPQHLARLERLALGTDQAVVVPAILRLVANPEAPLCDLLAAVRKAPDSGYIELAVVKALAASKEAAITACGDWSPTRALLSRAETLREAPGPRAWQAPMLALEALASRMPEEAGALARLSASKHPHWLVRATAVRVAAVTKDTDLAVQLMDDPHPNVRADALRSLSTLGYPLTVALAVSALDDKDYHLVRTAAMILDGAPDPVRLLPVLVTTFERLTEEGKDTSREPRLMLLTRIREFALRTKLNGTDWIATLHPYLEDFDPVIAGEVARVIFDVTGTQTRPRPKHRPAEQPTESDIRVTPACVIVQVEHADPWMLQLHRDRAPLAAARFWKLALAGYYDGHDITYADEVVALTGSPGGNEFVGADRFMRDEVGSPVRAGSMVILGHGRDTLDGRLQHLRKERRDRDRRVTVVGWAKPVVADNPASNPRILAPLPGNRIQSIVKCPE